MDLRPFSRPWQLITRIVKGFIEHDVTTEANAIAFSAMMATVPMIALLVSATLLLLPDLTGPENLRALDAAHLDGVLRVLLPPEAVRVVIEQIARLQSQPTGVLTIPIVVGLCLMFYTASGLFGSIMNGLNKVYGVKETRPFWRVKLIAMMITILQLAMILSALLVITGWPQIVQMTGIHEEIAHIAGIVKWTAVTVAILISYALWFRFGPASRQKRKWVTAGGMFGSSAFILVCIAFKTYMVNFARYDVTYGSLGGVMALLLWYWLNGVILLLAAEINRVLEEMSREFDDAAATAQAEALLLPVGKGQLAGADPATSESGALHPRHRCGERVDADGSRAATDRLDEPERLAAGPLQPDGAGGSATGADENAGGDGMSTIGGASLSARENRDLGRSDPDA